MNLFCFGYGYCASEFAQQLDWQNIHKTHRAKPFTFNTLQPLAADALKLLRQATHILISIPPDDAGDIVLRHHVNDIISNKNLQWVGYLSTTGVYGNHNGGWVDEYTTVSPTNQRSINRVKAEQEWLALDIPVNIYRLSGIYGSADGRNIFSTIRAGKAKRIYTENQYFNRIHVDDICQVLAASIKVNDSKQIYNLADDMPAPAYEVTEYACKLLGIKPPDLKGLDDTKVSEMSRSFYQNSRRVSNDKVTKQLGVKLKHPNYKVGLKSLIKN